MPFGKPGNKKLLLICASEKGFGVVLGLIFMALINYLFHPIYGNETKCCFEPYFLGEFGMVSCLVKLKKKTFLVGFVVRLIMMVNSFGIALFPPFVELRNSPEFLPLMSRCHGLGQRWYC